MGGNVVPNAVSIKKEQVAPAISKLQHFLPKGLTLYPIGSAGKKAESSDIDALIDANELMKVFPAKDLKSGRKELEEYFKSKGLFSARTGVSVHVGIPLGSGSDVVQVDLMAVENAKAAQPLHTHDYSDPSMKGGTLHGIWADLAKLSTLPGRHDLMMSPYKGLVDRETKDLITNDKDQIAKIIIGPTAIADDMSNINKMLRALAPYSEKYEFIKKKYSDIIHEDISEFLPKNAGYVKPKSINETSTFAVGRKYQHIEDLVLSGGSHGGLHAVERLRDMSQRGGTVELKWDGMPVVYWGRDEQGTFSLIPKNAWSYLKNGKTQTASGASTIIRSPKDVRAFVLGTGNGDPKEREIFANQFASWWPYFEKISPTHGYIEGGLLFYPGQKADGSSAMPVLNTQTNTYDFRPNVTTFHVPANSNLGKQIAQAKIMVAATGYYPSLGSSDEQRFPNAEKLSKPGIVVQGTTYIQDPVPLDQAGLANLEAFIKKNAKKIDNFLAGKPGLSNPGAELYSYLNKHFRTKGLLSDFPAWAKANLSPKKTEILLADAEGLKATLGAIESICAHKTLMIDQLSQGTHGGIKQTKPEGYAQAHPNIKFNHDMPGQFIKTIDQTNWDPKQSIIKENKNQNEKSVVIGWGRGMGHTGHDALVTAIIHQAAKTGAMPLFVVSRTFGKNDPIPPEEKLSLYRKKFPKYAKMFSLPPVDHPNLNTVLTNLASKGFSNVTLVVGADQKDAFSYLIRPNKSGDLTYKTFGLNSMKVLSRQETGAQGSDPNSSDYHDGPRATPMREILLDPSKSEKEQFALWRKSMSRKLSDEEVLHIMNTAKQNLKKFSSTAQIDQLKEYVDRIKPLIPYATNEQKQKFVDMLNEAKQRIDPKCWKGKHKEGTKIKNGIRVNNCVPNTPVNEDESITSNNPQGIPENQTSTKPMLKDRRDIHIIRNLGNNYYLSRDVYEDDDVRKINYSVYSKVPNTTDMYTHVSPVRVSPYQVTPEELDIAIDKIISSDQTKNNVSECDDYLSEK